MLELLPFPFRLALLGASVAIPILFGFHMGNEYGANARAYRKVLREIAAKNDLIRRQNAVEEARLAKEEAERTSAFGAATAALANLNRHCFATQLETNMIGSVK